MLQSDTATPASRSLQTRTHCAVCNGSRCIVVCSAAEVRRQHTYLAEFHRRRLRDAARRNELIDRADFTQDYVTDIVRCDACGFVFRHQQPVPEAAASTYAEDRYGSERLEALFTAQRELFRPRAERLQQRLRAVGRTPLVIEIGSFVGGFLMAAQERSWRAIGIDPGREVAAFCRTKGLTVVEEAAADTAIAGDRADAVCVWNTFDQLPDPRATLDVVTRWLRPDGVLTVRVPNGDCFSRCMARLRTLPRALQHPLRVAMAWNNLLSFPYLHGYSIDTLDRLLGSFSLRRIAFHPSVLPRLADEHTKRWAVCEEQCIKSLWRALTRYEGRTAPWFDAYYRLQRAN